MINVILAVDQNYGIGINNVLPWYIPEELKLFRKKTLDSILIVGRKTAKFLPYLVSREIYCITSETGSNTALGYRKFSSFDLALTTAQNTHKDIYVIGGAQIFNHLFTNYPKENIRVHISFIPDEYKCDTYFDRNHLRNFCIESETITDKFRHCVMSYRPHGEQGYMDLISEIIEDGDLRDGRSGKVISTFCKHLKFDLRNGFPLLTTKKMFLKGIIEELLFFIRGDTNSRLLDEKGVKIWAKNTTKSFKASNPYLANTDDGIMGPMYGYQWRHYNAAYDPETIGPTIMKSTIDNSKIIPPEIDFDQIQAVVNLIKKDPNSRRILLTTYNPSQAEHGVLYPCHSIINQFYVNGLFLDMFCYNRSSDVGLGLPFNIASSSLLLMLISELTNLVPRYFHLSLGDAHIYANHEDALIEQCKRIPYAFPKLTFPIVRSIDDIEKLRYEDFKIENYNYYPTIKMEMSA